MAKQPGLGDGLLVGGYDLSGDTGSIERISGGMAVIDLTGINRSAFERGGGRRDGGIDWTSFFNDAAGAAHLGLSPLPRTDTLVTYLRGTAIGSPAACLNAKQIGYDGTREDLGAFTFKVEGVANLWGLEWGDQVTAGLRTDTGATDGASRDFAAATNFGLQAYLQVTAFTGTDVTIRLQESSDDGAGDAFANVTDGAFASVTTAPSWQRIQTGRTAAIERYLRVITATTGGFSSVTFNVAVVKNTTAVTF